MAPPSPDEVVQTHAAFGEPEFLVARRRAIYSAAVELAAGAELAASLPGELLDDPVVRAHLGGFLAGTTPLTPERLRPTESVRTGGAAMPRVACTRPGARMLEPALARIRGVLARRGDDSGGALLTVEHPDFGPAMTLLADGIALARSIAPRLVEDLMPHVGLFAMITRDETGLLGSASDREYPGLIVLPTPRSAIEVAEALVHEGAHQKLFDLAVTRTVFGSVPSTVVDFRPSWAPATAPAWPLAQCVAAFHAYTLLGAFATEVETAEIPLHDYSLLPHARLRAAEIARRLARHAGALGVDGRRLLNALAAEPLDQVGPAPSEERLPLTARAGHVERRCGDWTLLVAAGSPVGVWWVPSGA